jgi:hypothetical protein
MKCSDVQDRLSAYYDGELSGDLRAVIASHLAACELCAAEFATLDDVTQAVSRMPLPPVPAAIWDGIVAKLSDETANSITPQSAQKQGHSRPWLIALAASLLLMLGVGYWMKPDAGHSGDHEHIAEFVATMDHYLQRLPHDPLGAEQFLLNKYEGQTVTADSAVKLVGYRPAVSGGLPEGYSLASTSVLKMPCCTCVKAVCKRQDGSTFVLFEHDDEKAEWFGNRPSNMATCGDKECCLVSLDSSIAATWKQGSRSVTAVGVRNLDEVNALVMWLDRRVGTSL